MLFLGQLVDHLMLRGSFSKPREDIPAEEAEYTDYTPWYVRPDGIRHTTAYDYDKPSGHAQGDFFTEESKRRVRYEMATSPEDSEELIHWILKPSQPPCMHRFQRHQDIKLTSIGVLKWPGNLPPDDSSKAKWQTFWNEASAGLQAWLEGAPSSGELTAEIYGTLGKRTERRKAIVGEFLLGEKTGPVGYYWLKEKVHQEGATAWSLFESRDAAQRDSNEAYRL